MRVTKQLMTLGGLLSARPISPDSYKLDELLAGLGAERKRLGKRRFVDAEPDPNQRERLVYARQLAELRQTAEESNRQSNRRQRRTNRLAAYKHFRRQA